MSNWRTSILFNETKESFAVSDEFYSNKGIIRWKSWVLFKQRNHSLKKLSFINMKIFNMKRFVKKNLTKKKDLISQCVALNSRENQAEIFHWSFVNWYLHLRTWLLLLLRYYTLIYGDITVSRHCGKCFYDFLTSPRD